MAREDSPGWSAFALLQTHSRRCRAAASALRQAGAGSLPVLLTTQRPEAGQNGRELLLLQKRRSGSDKSKN